MHPIKEIKQENLRFFHILERIQLGEIDEGIIAELPNNKGNLYINHFKVSNITQKHGDIPLENMIITATEPTLAITGAIDKMDYITLVYQFVNGAFVLSTRKFNGHYVVTFFEPSDANYIESIKRRGDILFDKKKTP